jgi:hypothetical protein
VWTFDIHAIIQNLEQLNSICIATGPTPTFINWATVSTSIQAHRFAQVGGNVTKMELCTENTYSRYCLLAHTTKSWQILEKRYVVCGELCSGLQHLFQMVQQISIPSLRLCLLQGFLATFPHMRWG